MQFTFQGKSQREVLKHQVLTSFAGSAITIFGLTSPESGSYNVTVDNHSITYSGHSSFTNFVTLLHYASELESAAKHEVVVQNMENKTLAMSVGGINTTSLANTPR